MTDEQIKEVLIGTQNYMLSCMPKTEWKHEYSPKFRRNMKKLIEKDKHLLWYYAVRVAAVIILLVSVSGGLLIGFHEEVRAQILGWILEQFADGGYRYHSGANLNVEITGFSLESLVPTGYHLAERIEEENRITEIYVDSDELFLFFTVLKPGFEGESDIIVSEDLLTDTANWGNTEANLYISPSSSEPNIIVWQGEKGILFTIQGFMTKEELIDIAKKIK